MPFRIFFMNLRNKETLVVITKSGLSGMSSDQRNEKVQENQIISPKEEKKIY